MIIEALPKGFVVRRPTMDDVEGATKLMNDIEKALYGAIETRLDDLRHEWQEPDFDVATDGWIVLSPQGHVVGLASVNQRKHVRLFMDINIHPNYQESGIGTILLNLSETRAAEHLALAAPGIRVSLNASTNDKNIAMQHLLERHGFKRIRSFWRMGIELHEAPRAPQWAEGITVRTLAPDMDMIRAVFDADQEAFRDHWGHTPMQFEVWKHWAVNSDGFDPSLWFLAMDGNEIAGMSLCADEREQGGWVHVLGVRRPWRRKGVGLALLHHSFGELYKRNIRNIYLGVDAQSLTGATRLYERGGMHVVQERYSYEKELRAGRELSTQSLNI